MRLAQHIALAVIDAEDAQLLQRAVPLHKFGDRFLAHDVPDLVEGLDHGKIDRIPIDVSHEQAVDLEEIDRQRLQVGERGKTAAKIIERKQAALALERRHELDRTADIGNGRGFGEFEADLLRRHRPLAEPAQNKAEKIRVAQTLAGEVDGTPAQTIDLLRMHVEPAQRGVDDIAVQPAGQVVALHGRQKLLGHCLPAVPVIDPHQYLVARLIPLRAGQRHDRLVRQMQATGLQCVRDRRYPLRLALTPGQIAVVVAIDVDPVTPQQFRGVAGAVSSAQHIRHVPKIRRDGNDPDADADGEGLFIPAKAEILHRFLARARHPLTLGEPAVLHQHAELVSAQAGDGIARAHVPAQHLADAAQKLVAGQMSTGIVDDLELIQIHVTQNIFRVLFLNRLQHPGQPLLELASIFQPGERVVGSVIADLAHQLAGFRDVLAHDEDIAHPVLSHDHAGRLAHP